MRSPNAIAEPPNYLNAVRRNVRGRRRVLWTRVGCRAVQEGEAARRRRRRRRRRPKNRANSKRT